MIGFHSKAHLRNLGHDLYGRRVIRKVEKARVAKLQGRRAKLRVLKKAAGPKVAMLWRTGLMP
eukprot:8737069-Pyramimonas_sp.AAC.1